VQSGTEVAEVYCFDMISWDQDRDGAIELWSTSEPLLQKWLAHAGARPVQPVPFEYSDHQSFLDAGFVTAGISEEYVSGDYTPHYHMATDTFDKIDFEYLGAITRLAFLVVGDQ
jgi:hypothetical protein